MSDFENDICVYAEHKSCHVFDVAARILCSACCEASREYVFA